MIIGSLSLSTLLLLALPQGTPVEQPAQIPVDMISRFEVADQNRLALTPMLDGKIADEEWDVLSSSPVAPTYLQWEPGAILLAGKAPVGKDLIFSLDLKGDGWLVGQDNLEVRASWGDGGPVIKTRVLDADNRNAPIWQYAPLVEGMIKSAGAQTEGGWSVEVRVAPLDLQTIELGRTIGIRADAIEAGAATPEPFAPRATSLVTMRLDRGVGMPVGTTWAPQYAVRTVTPGDNIKIRLNFTAKTTPFRRAELRTEGLGGPSTKLVALPFPEVDKKGRAFLDYETPVAEDATRGYRILRSTLTGLNGETTVVQSSYRIADLVDFEVTLPMHLAQSPDSRVVAGHVMLRSNTSNRLDGTFTVEVPSTWSVAKGKDRKFTIYHSRGTAKIPVQLIAPQNAQGLIPIVFRSKIGSKENSQTYLLPIR